MQIVDTFVDKTWNNYHRNAKINSKPFQILTKLFEMLKFCSFSYRIIFS